MTYIYGDIYGAYEWFITAINRDRYNIVSRVVKYSTFRFLISQLFFLYLNATILDVTIK